MHQNIKSHLQRALARIYLQRVLDGLTTGMIPALMAWMCLAVLFKTGWIRLDTLWSWAAWALIAPAAGLLWALLHKVDSDAVAMRLDVTNQLKGRMTAAWCFLRIPPQERTPFMEAAIADASAHLQGVRVAQATPLRAPADLLPLGLILLAAVGLALVRPPTVRGTLPVEAPLPAPEAVLNEAELEQFKQQWQEEKKELLQSDAPQAQELAAQVDELFEQLEEKQIDREEFLKRLDKIQAERFSEEDQEARPIVDELQDLHKELESNKHTKDLADALKGGDLQKAADEVEKLAQALKDGKISDKDVDALAKKLEEVAEKLNREDAGLDKLLKEKEKEIEALKKELEKKLDEKQKQRLSRLERELDLFKQQRTRYQEGAKGRTLKSLSRAAKEGAEKLRETKAASKGKDAKAQQAQKREEFGKAMEKAASELRGTDKKAQQGEAKEQVKQRLDELKETARRNSGGKNQEQRAQDIKDFEQRAQGKQALKPVGEAQEGQEGQEGQPQGDGQQPQAGQEGQEGQPKGIKPTDKPGEGAPKGQMAGLEQPGGQGGQPQAGEKPGGGKEQDGGQGDGKREGSDAAGQGGGEETLGEATKLEGAKFKDTVVEGKQGGGPTRSEVIKAAASKGFATQGYQDVHAEYERVAEEVLETEKIPPGYRFYVRRYFDMIRPREGGDAGQNP
jgi:hypothetical protein